MTVRTEGCYASDLSGKSEEEGKISLLACQNEELGTLTQGSIPIMSSDMMPSPQGHRALLQRGSRAGAEKTARAKEPLRHIHFLWQLTQQ